jgi:hypothetical protein
MKNILKVGSVFERKASSRFSWKQGMGGGGGWPKTSSRHRNYRKSRMVKDHYQLFMCIVVYVYLYNLSMR